MRYSLLILAVALTAGTTKARADLVTYNMTGTITSANDGYSSFAVGDHISWTLQYNASMPMYTYATTANNASQLYNPLITSIVDHTTGSRLYVPTTLYVPPYLAGGEAAAGASLNLSSSSSSSISANQYQFDVIYPEETYNAGLKLNANGPLPTLNLANLQLNQLSINTSTSSFGYGLAADMDPSGQASFTASVDSISAPKYTPEPGSLMLSLLGAAGLAACGIRHRRKLRCC